MSLVASLKLLKTKTHNVKHKKLEEMKKIPEKKKPRKKNKQLKKMNKTVQEAVRW